LSIPWWYYISGRNFGVGIVERRDNTPRRMFVEGVSKEEGESACFSIVEDENLMGPVDAPAVLDDLELGDEESVEIKGWRGKLNNSKSSFYITPL
jgi:hypothetical protein